MRSETPFEIAHLPGKLRADFTGKVPEAASGKPEERELNFLSRALAAYSVHMCAKCTIDEAADSLVDGGGDGGIDALYHSPQTEVLWVVQSKFFADGRGEPALGDITKFKEGLENLLRGKWEAFENNSLWKKRLPWLKTIFARSGLKVHALVVYSGINSVSDDRIRALESLVHRFSYEEEYFKFQFCSLETIHDWLTGKGQVRGIDKIVLTLQSPGWVKRPYETVYGILPLDVLFKLYRDHGKRLIEANIRAYKGDTTVNEQIVSTIQLEPKAFLYLNNGLTAYCQRLEIAYHYRDNAAEKEVTAYGFSIVNGAQTLGSIAAYFERHPGTARDGFVFLKVISLQRHEDERTFANRITRSTNFQNQIGLRDFVSQDEQQERIAKALRLSGIIYHYKDDVDTPRPNDKNFMLEEATSALACLVQQNHCDLCARIVSQRQSLWSFDDISLPEETLQYSRYEQIFRPELSARTVWRAVQTQRIVMATMSGNRRTSKGIRRLFFDHCRWLILNVIFLKLRPEQSEQLELTQEEKSDVVARAQEWAEDLWTICENQGFVSRTALSGGEALQTRSFRAVFGDSADCKRLRSALLKTIAHSLSDKSITDTSTPEQL